jgi:hypothetical protein
MRDGEFHIFSPHTSRMGPSRSRDTELPMDCVERVRPSHVSLQTSDCKADCQTLTAIGQLNGNSGNNHFAPGPELAYQGQWKESPLAGSLSEKCSIVDNDSHPQSGDDEECP